MTFRWTLLHSVSPPPRFLASTPSPLLLLLLSQFSGKPLFVYSYLSFCSPPPHSPFPSPTSPLTHPLIFTDPLLCEAELELRRERRTPVIHPEFISHADGEDLLPAPSFAALNIFNVRLRRDRGSKKNVLNKILVVAEYFYELQKTPGGQPKVFQCVVSSRLRASRTADSRGRWFPFLLLSSRPPSLPPSQMVQIGPEVKRSLKQMKH